MVPIITNPSKGKRKGRCFKRPKKRDCPAVITAREYEVFPQYGLKEENFQTLSGFVQRNLRTSKLKELVML